MLMFNSDLSTATSIPDPSTIITVRNCALGPCSFRDATLSGMLGMEVCDRSRPAYHCIHCCQGDGCNKDSGFKRAQHYTPLIVLYSGVLFLEVLLKQTYCIFGDTHSDSEIPKKQHKNKNLLVNNKVGLLQSHFSSKSY